MRLRGTGGALLMAGVLLAAMGGAPAEASQVRWLSVGPASSAVEPIELDAGGSVVVTIRHPRGSRPVGPLRVRLLGDGAFTIAADSCSRRWLRRGQTCTVTVAHDGADRDTTVQAALAVRSRWPFRLSAVAHLRTTAPVTAFQYTCVSRGGTYGTGGQVGSHPTSERCEWTGISADEWQAHVESLAPLCGDRIARGFWSLAADPDAIGCEAAP